MLLRVIAVGQRMPGWVETAVEEFSRRMPPEWRIEWRSIKAEPRQDGPGPKQWKERRARSHPEARAENAQTGCFKHT